MRTHQLTQGTPEWMAHRSSYWNASDTPAMLGCSKYKTRAQLIAEVATGLSEEVTPDQQRLYDTGHQSEALARPLAAEIVGEDLYPSVGTDDSDRFSASFDGLTMDEATAFEHKSLNNDLRAIMVDGCTGADLPLMYRAQMEHQCMVSGAERVLFMASKWNGSELVEERHCWYVPDLELRAQIVVGWAQFEADVAAYKPAEVVPAVVAEPVQALPAVLVKVTGEVAITTNFGAFETALRDFLEHRLIRAPKTDQDFADLDLQIKAMKGAEAALDAAEAQMLAQIQTVDTAKKTKDMLAALVKQNRLTSEKLLESEKARRKAEIVADGQAKLRQHVSSLTARVGVAITVAADFPGVIKGKKSLTSMEDAISTELARAKIEASRIADLIDLNNGQMVTADAGHLFPDFAQVCTKAAEDFGNLITSRRAAAQARADAERERIRAEEVARLEREAQDRAADEARQRQEADALAAREREAAEALARQQAAAPIAAPMRITAFVEEGVQVTTQPAPAPAPEVRTFVRTAAPAATQPEQYTVLLGQIQKRLAPIQVTAEGLAQLGFPYRTERGLKLYLPSDFAEICERISQHVLRLAAEAKKAA
jgi:putative phage-type endonuclease